MSERIDLDELDRVCRDRAAARSSSPMDAWCAWSSGVTPPIVLGLVDRIRELEAQCKRVIAVERLDWLDLDDELEALGALLEKGAVRRERRS